MTPTKEHARLLKEWQTRLGLQDWRILLKDNLTPEEMSDEEACGFTAWQEVIKTARIEMSDPKYYGNRIVPFDWEKTLVHELLHIKTCFLTTNVDDLQERIGHQLIDDLARAFVDAKRSGQNAKA